MTLNSLLTQKKMTKYQLSKKSGVPKPRLSTSAAARPVWKSARRELCTAIAQALGVSMESLLQDQMEKTIERRSSFEVFKSNMCHLVKDMGDINFLIQTLESDEIRRLYKKAVVSGDAIPAGNGRLAFPCEWAAPLRTIQRFARRQVETGSLPIQPGAGGESNEKPRTPTAERTGIYPRIMIHNIVEQEVRDVV